MDYFRALGPRAALSFVDQWLVGRQWLVCDHPTIGDNRLLGAAWCSCTRAASTSRNWPNVEAWSKRLKAMAPDSSCPTT